MRVLIKEPGKPWETAEVENTLEALQGVVGGYVETIPIVATDSVEEAVMVMDEEGRLKGNERNITICGTDIVGTVIICGQDGSEFCDAPEWLVRGLTYHEKKSAR
jgi:hypothetical protein